MATRVKHHAVHGILKDYREQRRANVVPERGSISSQRAAL